MHIVCWQYLRWWSDKINQEIQINMPTPGKGTWDDPEVRNIIRNSRQSRFNRRATKSDHWSWSDRLICSGKNDYYSAKSVDGAGDDRGRRRRRRNRAFNGELDRGISSSCPIFLVCLLKNVSSRPWWMDGAYWSRKRSNKTIRGIYRHTANYNTCQLHSCARRSRWNWFNWFASGRAVV